MIVQQYKIQCQEANGIGNIITWLESGMKINDSVSLKGIKGDWIVKEVYPHKIDKSDIKRDWKVGGL